MVNMCIQHVSEATVCMEKRPKLSRWTISMKPSGLTITLALLVSLLIVFGVDVLSLGDPVQVALQVFFQLLLLT